MNTSYRAETNRANAQLSTGPITPEGKQRSSLNALSHGLTSQIVVMSSEDPDAYQQHLKSFIDEYHPKGATEQHLVQALADASWRLNRVAGLETSLLGQDQIVTKALANLSMHSQRLSRQFERTLAQLGPLQESRRLKEKNELRDLLDVIEMYKSKGQTYDPSQDGFVFSEAEIHAAIQARNRKNQVTKASLHKNAA